MDFFPSDIGDFKSKLSKKTLKVYKNFWGKEEKNLERFLISSYVNKSLFEYILKRNITVNGKKILEFGCRDGSSFITFLYLKAQEIVGIDIDDKAIKLSKMIYNDLGFEGVPNV